MKETQIPHNISRYFLSFITILGLIPQISAQTTHIINPHIQTVQTLLNGEFGLPAILNLNSEDFLEISFDELSHEYHRYYYEVIHCDAYWEPSNITELDYIDGFNNNVIEDYETSINTTVSYTHYRFTIPNEEMQLTLSGNYRLTVYDDDNSSQPVFTTCFRILDKQIEISANVSTDTDIDRNKTHQQVNFIVNYKDYPIRNPREDIKAQIYQNSRQDNCITDLAPTYINSYQLKYMQNRDLIFEAGNEYRRFETVSLRFPNMHVESLGYFEPYYHATLMKDIPRTFNYSYDQDQNGRFLIRYDYADNSSLEADYFFVHFSLPFDHPFLDGAIYIQSDATYQSFSPTNKMKYNANEQAYECTLLLKQGSYNYQYVYLPNGCSKGMTAPLEGDFYETENEYLILIFGRQTGNRYDELIGIQSITFKP